MSLKNVTNDLNYQRLKVMRTVRRYLERLGAVVSETLYHFLGMIHLALITDAGLLIMVCIPILFRDQLTLQPISLAFLIGYVICDLVRLPLRHGATISLGFPLIFLTLLADSSFAALFNATLGSLISEALRSIFVSKQRHPWVDALRRTFFYAGHHALAGWGALLAYQLLRGRFIPQLLETTDIDIPATLAYIVVYSLISMLLVWPHDRRIWLFLAPNEDPFVRVDFLTTLLMLPIPAPVFNLFDHSNLGQMERGLIAVGVLPPLFILLFYLARNFTKVEEEREQLALREEIGELLGSTANMAEMMERVLTIMERLVDYHWGAAYSLVGEELKLCGVKSAEGPVEILDHHETEESWWSSGGSGKGTGQVAWPMRVRLGEGILGKLARTHLLPQFLDQGREPINLSEPYLPRKTALVVYPITVEAKGEVEQVLPRVIGMIALARPKRMFTTWDWEKGQALSSKASNVLLNVQRLEEAIRGLYRKVEDHATDPRSVRQAMQELIQRQVNVSQILAVVSGRSFQSNLRATLQGVVEGQRGGEISLAPEMLVEIYNQVRDETPGMPTLSLDIFQLLQTVTSSLSLAFSFPYQFPDVARGPAFKELYEFLLMALDANTISRITALDAQITSTVKTVQGREKAVREVSAGRVVDLVVLPPEVLEEVEELHEVVRFLKEYDQSKDLIHQKACLGQALDLLMGSEEAARERLRDPERFVFLQILAGWRAAITNALEDLMRGPARLKVSLRSHHALPLEETIVSLILQNQGPGVASSIVVELEPSQEYEVLQGKVDLGTLTSGKTEELEFALRPNAKGPLRLQFRIRYHDPERKSKAEWFADVLHLREPPIGFCEISNPYTPGSPLKPGNPTFVGREDIFNFIRQNASDLMRKMILVLAGERRTGKTSILKQLPAQLNDPCTIPIYIDGQQLGIDPGERNFFLSLTAAIADGLEEVGISIQRLAPEELGDSPQQVFERRFLPLVRERIGDRILLLTVDEFEELGARVNRNRLPPEIFPYLRHLIQHGDQLAFIFAGTHKIEELIGDYWSVLFNLAVYKKVEFLSREETTRLITEPVQPYGMMYDDLAISEILRLTGCHPYFTQLLCNILVNRCNEAHCNYVTVQNVRDAMEELLETGRAHLTFLWQTSDWEVRLTLAALAELRDKLDYVTTAAVTDRLSGYQLHLDPGQIMKTMEQLTARGIVHEIAGSPVSYEFTAHLYAHWLRHYKPLGKIVEEVSSELPSLAFGDSTWKTPDVGVGLSLPSRYEIFHDKLKSPPIVEEISSRPPILKNPFFHRGPIRDRRYFFGRKAETRRAFHMLRNDQCISIIGPRRIGKTSFLFHLCDSEVQSQHNLGEEYLLIYIDCGGAGNLDQSQFFQWLWREAKRTLADRGEAGGWTERIFDFSEFRETMITIREKGYKLVFLLDEFEIVAQNPSLDMGLFSALRSLVPTVIYATGSQDALYDLTYVDKRVVLTSPFYNCFEEIRLGLLEPGEAEEMVQGLLRMAGQEDLFTKEDLAFIFEVGGYYPFFLQLACYKLLEQRMECGDLGTEHYASIRHQYMQAVEGHFRYAWDNLDANERVAIRLVCNGRVKEIDDKLKQRLERKCILYNNTVFCSGFSEFMIEQVRAKAR